MDFDEAFSHENHHVRGAAFRKALDLLEIEYREDGHNGIASEYVYVTVWEDEENFEIEELKVRFADHGQQSYYHAEADLTFLTAAARR